MCRRNLEPKTAKLVRRVIFGLAVIALGGCLLLHNLGLVDVDLSLRFWPLLLVVLGISGLITKHPLHVGSHWLILLGIAFQVSFLNHGWYHWRWWPLGLVWLGLVMTARAIWMARSTTPICEDAKERSHDQQS